ncbi:MAG TPA: FAD-dependent oxidoreductase, partial [Polyangiaceae bacterium]
MPDCIQIGTSERPLRVAIVGAGPAGFHAAMALLESNEPTVEVDLFDRLPTPYGLIRAGVAPDHQKIKSVTHWYERIGQDPRFAFFGKVELGRDVTVEDLATHYDQILFATGNEGDRRLGVPGEHLLGCLPASVFVGWYNGHPDFQTATVNLTARRAVVIGNGNVALDVARILLKDPAELAKTDIAEHALLALRRSLVEEVVIVGRRGPMDAAFTPAELKELLNLPNVSLHIGASELILDAAQRRHLEGLSPKAPARRNYELLNSAAASQGAGSGRSLEFRFYCSPLEFLDDGAGNLVSVVLRDNRSAGDSADGVVCSDLNVGAALVSIGNEGKRIPGVPYDE